MTESGKGQPEMETIKAKTKARNVLAGVSAAPEETVRAETLAERQQRIQSAWVSFLLEHPTRGGLAERLIFQSGFDANSVSASSAPESEGWNEALEQAAQLFEGDHKSGCGPTGGCADDCPESDPPAFIRALKRPVPAATEGQ